jgi:CRP/FNR family transcriptional regulator, cyclic AMP receptor protein
MIETFSSTHSNLRFSAETLPPHPLFEGLGERDRNIFASCAMRATYEPGQLLAVANQPANCLHLIINGLVTLESPEVDSPVRVQQLGAGDVLGWSWLFQPYCWHFNAIAEQPTDTIFFYGSRILQACNNNHDFGYELFRRLSGILVQHLEPMRAKWIESAQSISPRSATPENYLMI